MKPYKLDTSQLKHEQRALPYYENFEDFMDKVAVANPLFDFVIDDSCVKSEWRKGDYYMSINTAKVFQDGEELGSISTTTRYHGGDKHVVYGVESFRIVKHRGNRNESTTKDIKVALRLVKKTIVPRADIELITHIKTNVQNEMKDLLNTRENHVRWGVNMHETAWKYMMHLYYAKKQGHTTVEMGVDKIYGVKDMEEYYKKFDAFDEAIAVMEKLNTNQGYGITTEADGKVVCYDYLHQTVKKYRDFDDLPKEVADKLSVFKLLEVDEVFRDYGAKLQNGFYFIVRDEISGA